MKLILKSQEINFKNGTPKIVWAREFIKETGLAFKATKVIADLFNEKTKGFQKSRSCVLDLDSLLLLEKISFYDVKEIVDSCKNKKNISYEIISDEEWSLNESLGSLHLISKDKLDKILKGAYKPSEEEIKVMAEYIKVVSSQKPAGYMSEGAHGVLGVDKIEVPVREKPFYNDEKPLYKSPIILIKDF